MEFKWKKNMKRQRITIGSILEINIEGKYYVYAQILGKAAYAFFDYKSSEKLTDFSNLQKTPILFIIAVYNDVITSGYWPKVGKIEIRENLRVQPMQFIQDPIKPDNFSLYNPNSGEIVPTTRDKIKGLERAAVWEASHVEERIRDYYSGVPNIWVEQLKAK